jgi:hypothetical protein
MTHVACFCGCVYSFSGEIAVCPRCGEYASFTRASAHEEQQMRDELALLLSDHGEGVGAESTERLPDGAAGTNPGG